MLLKFNKLGIKKYNSEKGFFYLIGLKGLIVFLSLFVSFLVLFILGYVNYGVQRDLLIKNTFDDNKAYAEKLAENIDIFFESMHRKLGYSARLLSEKFNDSDFLNEEVKRLRQQSIYFNTAHIVRSDSVLLAVNSEINLDRLVGEKLTSLGVREAIKSKSPLITKPYIASSKRMMIAASQPVFDSQGAYLGYVSGGLYLDGYNYLNRVLGEHFYRNGSYAYVIDSDGYLVQHPDKSRIGENVANINNAVVDDLMQGKSGVRKLKNSKGVDMLASYVYIGSIGWGVVIQTPVASALSGLNDIVVLELAAAIPFLIILVFLLYFSARKIAMPLRGLAESIVMIDDIDKAEKIINSVRPWYFEAIKLKQALLVSLSVLHEQFCLLSKEAMTDSLTGLYNKRVLERVLEKLEEDQKDFSLVSIDIDHFKGVNDKYGHAVGDKVIKHLAELMESQSRSSDLLFRNGGEEFLVIMPEAKIENAIQLAERLRESMMSSEIEGIEQSITISLGVSQWLPWDAKKSMDRVLAEADQALYMAKEQGRNRVVVYPTKNIWND